MTNIFQISDNPEVPQQRHYKVNLILTYFNEDGIFKVVTEGILFNTVAGKTPVNGNVNGLPVPLESTGATLEALKKLNDLDVSTALGKPLGTISFVDFYKVALAQGVAKNDQEGVFNVI